MNFRPNFLLALSVQLLCFVSVLEAYSNGSLTDACYTMAPVHGDAQPNTGPCSYETALSETTIIQGESLTITLRNITNNSFRGYMTMAFDASKPDDAGPVGTFGMPTDGQILSCPDGANNTISHKDNNSLKRNVQANWTAPVDFVGTVVFKTTFVKGESTFWVKEPSAESVTILTSTPSTETQPSTPSPTTVPPSGAPSLSYSWITGFILLMLAFSH
ncbi:putative ferric-chelate reductase 1 [Daphnia pulex]|uniref:putative ferric-chelate reductase 1 n=1 Tax=Daphnia pulex TaxID=6669 RepID=UPI001EE05F1B|nr:putative ferric-chelate reductase 1 [Daphnia pulex]